MPDHVPWELLFEGGCLTNIPQAWSAVFYRFQFRGMSYISYMCVCVRVLNRSYALYIYLLLNGLKLTLPILKTNYINTTARKPSRNVCHKTKINRREFLKIN